MKTGAQVSVASGRLSSDNDTERFAARLTRLNSRAAKARDAGLYFYHRKVEPLYGPWANINGKRMMMAASDSYLGLMNDPRVYNAVARAQGAFGPGSHGSRLLAGTTEPHRELEAGLADFFAVDDAIVFTSGYLANLTTIATLFGKEDVIISDRLNHASISAGCLHSGARVFTYAHGDVSGLEQCLASSTGAATLVVADAVFDTNGTILPLPEVAELCTRFDAQLMVDEAHSCGVIGATGRGVVEHFQCADVIDIRLGNLSKAIPSTGGFVCGSSDLVEALRHNAAAYIYSGALPPVQVAAASAGLEALRQEPERVQRLAAVSATVRDGLRDAGLTVLGDGTPIIPVLCDAVDVAHAVTDFCHRSGLFALPAVYPAVPLDSPRLRLSLTADYTDADAHFVIDVVASAFEMSCSPKKDLLTVDLG